MELVLCEDVRPGLQPESSERKIPQAEEYLIQGTESEMMSEAQ